MIALWKYKQYFNYTLYVLDKLKKNIVSFICQICIGEPVKNQNEEIDLDHTLIFYWHVLCFDTVMLA